MAILTVENAMKELRKMFPERDGIQATEHAWYWKERGRIQRSARVLLGPEYNAPKFEVEGEDPLAACMGYVRAWYKAQELNTVLPEAQQ